MTITPQGPTPAGERNRASTIPAKRQLGPSIEEWAWEELQALDDQDGYRDVGVEDLEDLMFELRDDR